MNRHQEVKDLEREADERERALEVKVGEVEAGLRAVTAELREVTLRLEEERARGATGLAEVLSRLSTVSVPAEVSLSGHADRQLEVRADHARARLWLASTLESELSRLLSELEPALRLAAEGRETLERLAERPRVRPRDQRLTRVQSLTRELGELGGAAGEAVRRFETHPRRQLPRKRFEVSIDLHSRSNFYTGITENISEGGVFIATEERLPLGTRVDLAFALPGGEEIRTHGVVRWVREPSGNLAGGLGLGFEELSEEAYLAIREFLESRAPIVR